MDSRDYKKEINDFITRQNIVKTIWCFSPNGKKIFVTDEMFVLKELVNRTFDYVQDGKYKPLRELAEFRFENYFKKRVFESFESKMNEHPNKLERNIKKHLTELIKPWIQSVSGPGEPYWTNLLRENHWGGATGAIHYGPYRTFDLLNETVTDVTERILPSFTQKEQKNLLGIGKAVRKYIDLDISYLSENGMI